MRIRVMHWDADGGEWIEEREATPDEEQAAALRDEQRRELWRLLLAPVARGDMEKRKF